MQDDNIARIPLNPKYFFGFMPFTTFYILFYMMVGTSLRAEAHLIFTRLTVGFLIHLFHHYTPNSCRKILV